MLEADPLAAMLMSPSIEEIREHLRCLRNIAEKGGAVDRLATAATGASVFRRDGDDWTIAYRGYTSRLRDCLGLRYLALLLENPGRRIGALEIATGVSGAAEARLAPAAEAVLDARARSEYRARLSALAAELAEAKAANDLGRCEVLQRESEAVRAELERSCGLGGRSRRFPCEAERARLNVTRAIRNALARISMSNPALGDHLTRSVRTGGSCAYDPDPAALPDWQLAARPGRGGDPTV